MRAFRPIAPFLCLALVISCAREAPAPVIDVITGRTMGTTYQVSVHPGSMDVEKAREEIDSLLVALNQSVSTYLDSSLISKINDATDTTIWHPIDPRFLSIFEASESIYEATEGAFNPAVGPLVEAWGFGPDPAQSLSDRQVDSLRRLIDFRSFIVDREALTLRKRVAGARLDFSAIAKGYGVDLVGVYLESQGLDNYFVEIGGEVRSRGVHPAGRPWRLGIDRPDEQAILDERPLQAIFPIADHAIATSGNYRNFYEKDGEKYVHTINPETGYPEISSLLSVSVIAPTCTEADGYATALMVMGLERAKAFVAEKDELEAYFISGNEQGEFVETLSEGFPEKLDL